MKRFSLLFFFLAILSFSASFYFHKNIYILVPLQIIGYIFFTLSVVRYNKELYFPDYEKDYRSAKKSGIVAGTVYVDPNSPGNYPGLTWVL